MKKRFINIRTGEVIERHTRMGANKYFKRDGKVCGYDFKKGDVVTETEFQQLVGAGFINAIATIVYYEEERADGNA